MSVSNEVQSTSLELDDHHRQSSAFLSGVGRKLRWAGTTCCKSTCARRTHAVRRENVNIVGDLPARFSSSSSNHREQDDRDSTLPRALEPEKPVRPKHPRIRLIPGKLVKPDQSPIQLNTSLPITYSRHYLKSDQAQLIPTSAFTSFPPDSYVLARSVELFGSPGRMDWVEDLNERYTPGVVQERVNGYLSRLDWMSPSTRALKDAAWAEHLVAMQNPNLRGELDEYEELSSQMDAPGWPSVPSSNSDLNISWSTSSERDEPRPSSPLPSPSFRRPAYLLGKHNFPRPKRILRLRPYDKSLVLVFASPNARRAILSAYAAWVRFKLSSAYKQREEKEEVETLEKLWQGVWPPITETELGGLRKDDPNYQSTFAAIEWANHTGWRPAYRIQPFVGIRKWGDDWHPRGKWSRAKQT